MTELSSSGLKVLGYASHETPLEAETRLWARFPSVEARLRQRFAFLELPFKDAAESKVNRNLYGHLSDQLIRGQVFSEKSSIPTNRLIRRRR